EVLVRLVPSGNGPVRGEEELRAVGREHRVEVPEAAGEGRDPRLGPATVAEAGLADDVEVAPRNAHREEHRPAVAGEGGPELVRGGGDDALGEEPWLEERAGDGVRRVLLCCLDAEREQRPEAQRGDGASGSTVAHRAAEHSAPARPAM